MHKVRYARQTTVADFNYFGVVYIVLMKTLIYSVSKWLKYKTMIIMKWINRHSIIGKTASSTPIPFNDTVSKPQTCELTNKLNRISSCSVKLILLMIENLLILWIVANGLLVNFDLHTFYFVYLTMQFVVYVWHSFD